MCAATQPDPACAEVFNSKAPHPKYSEADNCVCVGVIVIFFLASLKQTVLVCTRMCKKRELQRATRFDQAAISGGQ
jgi:hypothetical protein